MSFSTFSSLMKPDGGGEPSSVVHGAINRAFGSLEEFKAKFKQAGMTQFGSGWAWLVVNAEGGLEVTKTANQDSPASHGMTPILGVDVWEHAYYLHYQNRRADYIDAWWNVVDWTRVDANLEQALS